MNEHLKRQLSEFPIPFDIVVKAMEKAAAAQKNDTIVFSSPMFGAKAFREQSKKLLTALRRFESGNPTEKSYGVIRETLHMVPTKFWEWIDTTAPEICEHRIKLWKTTDHIDAFPVLLAQLIKTQNKNLAKELSAMTEDYINNNLNNSGKGGSKASTKYIDGILVLMASLEKHMPSNFGFSAQDGTPFNFLVSLWMEHYMDYQRSQSPREHIREALKIKKMYKQ